MRAISSIVSRNLIRFGQLFGVSPTEERIERAVKRIRTQPGDVLLVTGIQLDDAAKEALQAALNATDASMVIYSPAPDIDITALDETHMYACGWTRIESGPTEFVHEGAAA